MSFVILDAAGRRIATHAAPEDATYAGRTAHQDRLGWVVRDDGEVILVHPRVGRRVPAWPPPEDAAANTTESLTVPARPYCPIWAALRHPSTAAEVAAVVPGVDRAEVSRTLLRWLDEGLVTWERAVWARVPGAPRPEVGQPASETPRRGGLGYQPCHQPRHPTTTPPASPSTSPECRPRPRRPWSSPPST